MTRQCKEAVHDVPIIARIGVQLGGVQLDGVQLGGVQLDDVQLENVAEASFSTLYTRGSVGAHVEVYFY